MSPAEKQKRYRQRVRDGRIVVRVELDAVDAAEALVRAGYLSAEDYDNAEQIGRALERAMVRLVPADEA